jgi:hypothetical protein
VDEEQPIAPPPVRRPRPAPPATQPPVVVYQPVPTAPPPQVIVITPGYGYGYGYAQPPAYAHPVRPIVQPTRPRWEPEWGFNLRVEGIPLGHTPNSQGSAGLGGVGLSLRYRPVPAFAFDLGVDVLAGNDYNGFSRTEVPISLNGIIYLNPRSRVQVYLQGGGMISRAQVRSDSPAQQLQQVGDGTYGATYTYAGGQGGGGFEFRLSRRVALDLDALGFVRTRIGDVDPRYPEFIDHDTNKTSNTSGGALIRGGLTFWW